MGALSYQQRPADAAAEGLLFLHHGRGADEFDLLPLADVLDPDRRLHVVTPAAPLRLPDAPGRHWYLVRRVGYPDPDTFRQSLQRLVALHEQLQADLGLGPERTILGGFSQGTVMSYAAALLPQRVSVAGILAASGFIPQVQGWRPELAGRAGLPVLITHGRQDPLISVEFARSARATLQQAGVAVEYHESEAAHHIDPGQVRVMVEWIRRVLAPAPQ